MGASLDIEHENLTDGFFENFKVRNDLSSVAADKTGTMTLDKVIYINSIFGINQLGTLPGEVVWRYLFRLSRICYDKGEVYGTQRGNHGMSSQLGQWLHMGTSPSRYHRQLWASDCLNILDEVHHLRGNETMNVRAFTQAADDALQVLEYIHEYRVPVALP